MSTLPAGAAIGTCTCGATTYTDPGGQPQHTNGRPCPGRTPAQRLAVPERCASGGRL